MSEIVIQLNKTEFVGGETIIGEVNLHLDQDTPMRGVRLFLKGFEQSSWREGSGKRRHTHSETKYFFDEELTLQGRPRLSLGELVADSFKAAFSKDSYEVLRAGTYRYPFTYVLPLALPSDYESSLTNSRICYGVTAQVDLPLKFDLDTEQPLDILEPPRAAVAQPVSQRETKQFLFDSDSTMEATVHLAKDTFCLGEELECEVEVFNRAPGKEVRAVTLALRQIERAWAQDHTNIAEKEVSRFTYDECRFPANEVTRMHLTLPIPGDVYPTIAGGSLVQLHYDLKVTLDIPWAVDAKLLVPITLVSNTVIP